MIGLTRNTVQLVPHDPTWAPQFEEEKARLGAALGGKALDIQHIGSTAIPGIKAKPVIDIALGVESMADHASHRTALERAGYVWRPGFGDADHHLVFAKGNDASRTHYLHLMRYGGPEWEHRILFRDYLRAHPDAAREYEWLKEKSASSFPDDRKRYTEEKDLFVQRIIGKAKR